MRRLCYAIILTLALASCRDKVICAAFQSTYILDDSVRSTYHSYLWYLSEEERTSHLSTNAKIPPPDSLGVTVASADESGVDYWAYTAQYKVPPRQTKKTKYGIAKRTPVIPNIVRNFQMKTSPMENVLAPPEVRNPSEKTEKTVPVDSSAYAPLDSTAAVADVDSINYTATDSLGVAQVTDSTAVTEESKVEKAKKEWARFKYGFNPLDSMQPDQEYYFRKYGWLLQNQPPPDEPEQAGQPADSVQSDSTQRKGLKGLFKKKDKQKKEKRSKSEEEEVPDESVNDEATTTEEESSEPEETQEEDTDDGF